jgi:aminopeptidase-like protein
MAPTNDTYPQDVGQAMHHFMHRLYPVCRSITGDGFRHTLRSIGEYIPLVTHEIPTGTQVFDWIIPKEWNIKDAYVKNDLGQRVVDFRTCNLHVMSYSVPVKKVIPLRELRQHLHSIPDHPDWVPYRTSYYDENWGFCLSHNTLMSLTEGEYEVCIDSTLVDGHLTYGEYYIEGKEPDEVLFSCHACHPSLCNDNLSGIALTTFLAKALSHRRLKYSYRFLFIPGTIGSITWLARNEANLSKIKHGLVVVCVGDAGMLTYKKTRRGNATIDQAVVNVLKNSGTDYDVIDFSPYGYDERQYCSPGFDLPVGSLSRTPHGDFSEYHNSADDLSFVKPVYLEDSYSKYLSVIEVLEGDGVFTNLNPKCEPQLGKRGLYQSMGGQSSRRDQEMAMFWVLNLSDGHHSLLDISDRSELEFGLIRGAADRLMGAGLLREG